MANDAYINDEELIDVTNSNETTTMSNLYPTWSQVKIEDLKLKKQWCNWELVTKEDGKTTKEPKNPHNIFQKALTNNSDTWGTYEQAEQNNSNIGIVFDKGLCGIDVDGTDNHTFENCLQAEIVEHFKDITYIEKSPSGAGVHVLFYCNANELPTVPNKVNKETGEVISQKLDTSYYSKNPNNGIEIYFSGLTSRYFTFTGNQISTKNEIAMLSKDEIISFLDKYMIKPIKNGKTKPNKPKDFSLQNDISFTDGELIDKIKKSNQGSKFNSLFNGDTSNYNEDDSSADLALCCIIAWWSGGNPDIIDKIFRQSELYRKKWEREDYRANTINLAIDNCNGKFYTPNFNKAKNTEDDFLSNFENLKYYDNLTLRELHENDRLFDNLAKLNLEDWDYLEKNGNLNKDDILATDILSFLKYKNDGWELPIPLTKKREEYIPFPVDALPLFFADYMKSFINDYQVSVAMPSVIFLGLLATCFQRKYKVKAKFNDNYAEELSLFTLVVARSASRKSSVLKHFSSIIKRYEKKKNEELRPEIEFYNSKLQILNEQKKEIEKKQKDSSSDNEKNDDEELRGAIYKISEHKKNSVCELELTIQDFTPEALSDSLEKNNGVISIVDSEGGLFNNINGKYNKVPDFNVILAGHTADPVKIVRVGTGKKEFNPNISMIITTQPIVLNEALKNIYFKRKGLLARFLFSYPEPIQTDDDPIPMPKELMYDFEQRIIRMLDVKIPEFRNILYLCDDAKKEYDKYKKQINPLIYKSNEDFEPWLARLTGLTLRLAGLLHLAEGKTHEEPISTNTYNKAIEIAEYFKVQAEQTLSYTIDEEKFNDMKFVLKHMTEMSGVYGESLKARDVYKKCHKTKAETEPIFNDLQEYGYIRITKVKKSEVISISPFWDRTVPN